MSILLPNRLVITMLLRPLVPAVSQREREVGYFSTLIVTQPAEFGVYQPKTSHLSL
jgi:hypothetical protein